jgi:hypothetical protein
MESLRCVVRSLTEETWTAFATLVEADNGIFGGCWCIGDDPEGGRKDGTVIPRTLTKMPGPRRVGTHVDEP